MGGDGNNSQSTRRIRTQTLLLSFDITRSIPLRKHLLKENYTMKCWATHTDGKHSAIYHIKVLAFWVPSRKRTAVFCFQNRNSRANPLLSSPLVPHLGSPALPPFSSRPQKASVCMINDGPASKNGVASVSNVWEAQCVYLHGLRVRPADVRRTVPYASLVTFSHIKPISVQAAYAVQMMSATGPARGWEENEAAMVEGEDQKALARMIRYHSLDTQ